MWEDAHVVDRLAKVARARAKIFNGKIYGMCQLRYLSMIQFPQQRRG